MLRTLNAPLSSLITDSSLTNSRGRWSCERRLSTLYFFLNFFNVSTICPDGQMIIVSLLQKISKQKAGTPSQDKVLYPSLQASYSLSWNLDYVFIATTKWISVLWKHRPWFTHYSPFNTQNFVPEKRINFRIRKANNDGYHFLQKKRLESFFKPFSLYCDLHCRKANVRVNDLWAWQ